MAASSRPRHGTTEPASGAAAPLRVVPASRRDEAIRLLVELIRGEEDTRPAVMVEDDFTEGLRQAIGVVLTQVDDLNQTFPVVNDLHRQGVEAAWSGLPWLVRGLTVGIVTFWGQLTSVGPANQRALMQTLEGRPAAVAQVDEMRRQHREMEFAKTQAEARREQDVLNARTTAEVTAAANAPLWGRQDEEVRLAHGNEMEKLGIQNDARLGLELARLLVEMNKVIAFLETGPGSDSRAREFGSMLRSTVESLIGEVGGMPLNKKQQENLIPTVLPALQDALKSGLKESERIRNTILNVTPEREDRQESDRRDGRHRRDDRSREDQHRREDRPRATRSDDV